LYSAKVLEESGLLFWYHRLLFIIPKPWHYHTKHIMAIKYPTSA